VRRNPHLVLNQKKRASKSHQPIPTSGPTISHSSLNSPRRGSDGSLTILVQSESPGADKESNWLPSPKGEDFSLYIRAYWPKLPILDRSSTPPSVENVK